MAATHHDDVKSIGEKHDEERDSLKTLKFSKNTLHHDPINLNSRPREAEAPATGP
jgi:hypothetical protein